MKKLLLILALAVSATAQTTTINGSRVIQGDLTVTGKTIATARPVSALPGTCTDNELVVLTSVTPNTFHRCQTNAWVQIGAASGGSGTYQSLITDVKPSSTSTVLTIAAGRVAGYNKTQATATITAGSGSGSYVVYGSDTGAIVIEHSTSAGLTVSCSGCVTSQVTTPTIPFGMQPIASGLITSGAWGTPTDVRNGIDLPGHRHQPGTGMATVCVAGVCVDAVDPAVVQLKSGNYTPLGQFDASGASKTVPMKVGTSVPGSCSTGEFYYKSDAAAGSRIYECSGGTFTLFSGGSSSGGMRISQFYHMANSDAGGVSTLNTALFFVNSSGSGGNPGADKLGSAAPYVGTAKFGPSGTTTIHTSFAIPADWTGSIILDATVPWLQISSGGPSGDYVWGLSAACPTNPASITWNTESVVTTADAGIHTTNYSTATGINTTGCSAGKVMYMRIRRLGDSTTPADNGTQEALALGLGFTIRNQ